MIENSLEIQFSIKKKSLTLKHIFGNAILLLELE